MRSVSTICLLDFTNGLKVKNMTEKNFSVYYPSEVKLSEKKDVPPEVQVLKVGKFKHPSYGEFEITPETLVRMKENFEKKVRRVDIAFDYFHDSDKIAAGWPKALELREDGAELWATNVEWTPRAKQMLADKELRYFSPDFSFEWTDPETGAVFKDVLFGGGLTNRPFLKDMAPITSLSEKLLIDDKDLQACVSSLVGDLIKKGHSQEQAVAIAYSKCGEKRMGELKQKGEFKMEEKDKMIEELKAQIADLQAKLDLMKSEHEKMSGEKEVMAKEKMALEDKIKCSELEKEFTVLLSEGKACVAQKDAFLKGDMKEFIAKAQPLNLSEKGSNKVITNVSDALSEIKKLADEKMKANNKLDRGEAISLVLSENDELRKAYEDQK